MRKSREEGNTRNKEKQEERKQDRRGCDHPWGSREKEQALAVAEMGGLGHSPGDRRNMGGRPSIPRREVDDQGVRTAPPDPLPF